MVSHSADELNMLTTYAATENTIEKHWPLHNYMGPGTHVVTRVLRGDIPINPADATAMLHDVDYLIINNRPQLQSLADDYALQRLSNLNYLDDVFTINPIKRIANIYGTISRVAMYSGFKIRDTLSLDFVRTDNPERQEYLTRIGLMIRSYIISSPLYQKYFSEIHMPLVNWKILI